MQLICPKDILLEKLQIVLKTVATKSTLPVLSGIKFTAAGDEPVELASTNMELSLRLKLPATVEGPGSAVLPGRLLTDVIRSMPVGDIRVEVDEKEQQALITSAQVSFKLNCLPASDFPRLVDMPEDDVFQVKAEPLLATINTVARAASRDETRPVLTGILVKFGSDSVKMVATDSYRLSVRETKVDSTLTQKKEVIVPKSSMEELARLGTISGAEKISVGAADGQILFAAGDTLLTSRLIEGQFPNYQQLLPDELKHEVEFEKEELLEVVGRVGLMAQKNVPLRLKFSPGELNVSAQTPQVGEAQETLAIAFDGEETEIGFNAEYLREGIESVDEEHIFIRIISPLRPGLIKGSGDDFLYLVMPVRLTS